MQPTLSLALEAIRRGEINCAVFQQGAPTYESAKRGVAPLMELLDDGRDLLNGAEIADKLIGKAAAMLLALGNAKSVCALVMSESALDFLKAHQIDAEYETLIPMIINRQGTGPCPMEAAVEGLTDPAAGKAAIAAAIARMRAQANAK